MPLLDPDAMPPFLAATLTARDASVVAGIGEDDCAVLVPPAGASLVVTTDYFNARPIALELGLTGLRGIGRLLVAANLSDLLGSGAVPHSLLLSLMFARGSNRDRLEELIGGIQTEADRHRVFVVGGDTKLGAADAFAATAIGWVPDGHSPLLMNGAEAGQELWVSGPIGSVGAATYYLATDAAGRETEIGSWSADRILEPHLPTEQSRTASRLVGVTGGSDISDGLSADLHSVCRASGVAIEVDVAAIPMLEPTRAIARAAGIPDWAMAFATGGDFQFVCTADPNCGGELASGGLTRIGRVRRGTGLWLAIADQRYEVPDIGHRDARDLTFAEEVRANARTLLKLVT